MKAAGSKLIKVAYIKDIEIYQDTDTKKFFIEIFGTLKETDSLEEAINFINSVSTL